MTEDYVDLASNLMLTPLSQLGSYGYNTDKNQFPLRAISVVGYLKDPRRRRLAFERWSPYEVALFEGAIMEHGKEFHEVQKAVETKTTREVIDFYYAWKKTSHGKRWKEKYVPPHEMDESDDDAA